MEAGVTLSVSILLIIIHAVGANGYSTFGAEHFNFGNTQVIRTSLPFAFLLVEREGGAELGSDRVGGPSLSQPRSPSS
jgi:hypothetical protein